LTSAFVTLRELAAVPAADGGESAVLFLVPELTSTQSLFIWSARLLNVPVLTTVHDFLEKLSDCSWK